MKRGQDLRFCTADGSHREIGHTGIYPRCYLEYTLILGS